MNTFSIILAVELVPLLQAEVRKLREMLASQQLESQGRQPMGWSIEGEPKVTLWILLFQTKDIIIMLFSYEAIYQSSLTLLSANYWSEL
jgi:hypothetical protein